MDLSRFQQGNALEAGVYQLDLYLNGNRIGRERIQIKTTSRFLPDSSPLPSSSATVHAGMQPCLPATVLERIGVDLSGANTAADPRAPDTDCLGVDDLPAASQFEVDIAELRADLSIPQIYLEVGGAWLRSA